MARQDLHLVRLNFRSSDPLLRIAEFKAKLKLGNDANLARLKQFISEATPPSTTPTVKPPPSDPALAFADRAASVLGQSLIHCQEAILPGESSPVVL
ncbi:MAG: hypothetical protein ABL974_09950 [Prosthecobacter sp.]